jgi:hypothetical protein
MECQVSRRRADQKVIDGSEEANKIQGRSIEASGYARRAFSDRAVDSSRWRAQHDRDGTHIWFGALGFVCGETNFLKRLRWRARNRKSRSGGHRTAHFRNCRLEVRFHRYDFGEAVKVRADFAGP